jgi:hypothetical protein
LTSYRTPAQNTRVRIRLGIAGVALLVIGAGAVIRGGQAREARRVLNDHASAIATVTKVERETLEVRFRSRRGSHDLYMLGYTFQVAGQSYSRRLGLQEDEYAALRELSQIEVWYPVAHPERSAPEVYWRGEARRSSLVVHALSLAIFVAPAAYVLQLLLVLLFAREPKDAVPEGFVTESSWLDVDDSKLVALDDDALVIVTFNAKRTAVVQRLYQARADVAQIMREGQGAETRIPFDAITEIETPHYADTFTVSYESAPLPALADFLTPAVKEHALARLTARLNLERSQQQLTRARAVLPSAISLCLCGALTWFLQVNTGLMALAGVGVLFALRTGVTRLVDPPRISRWARPAKRPSLQPTAAA